MGLVSMIQGATIALGAAGSLYKNPTQAGLNIFSTNQAGMTVLATAMTAVDPTFSPTPTFTSISSALSAITTSITAKISNLSSELSLTTAAATMQSNATAVDAVLSGNPAAIPNQITQAYPPPSTTSSAFTSLTGSNAVVSTGAVTVASNFDNTGDISILYSALNALPGVSITNGTDLLHLLGTSPTPAVVATVNSTIAGSPALLAALELAFTAAGSSTGPMTTSFNALATNDAAAVSSAISFVMGGNVVSMINSTNPSIANVMSSVIDPAQVDQASVSVAGSINKGTISLPGDQSVAITSSGVPPNLNVPAPVVSAAIMATPTPGYPAIDPYTEQQISDMGNLTVAQHDLKVSTATTAANWYKTNLEDWMITVQFQPKKVAAGASKANPVGTSTDPVVLAAWKDVYDQWLPRTQDYINNYLAASNAASLKYTQMFSEWQQRKQYGKYPYTYQIAQGVTIPADQQYTYLDTTK